MNTIIKYFNRLFLFCLLMCAGSLQAQLCDPNTNSFRFDGTSSYIGTNSNTDLNISDSLTVEAWINASAFGPYPSSGSIVCKHGWTFNEEGYVLRAGGNGQLSFNFSAIKSNGTPVGWKELLSAPGALQLSTWHHVAATYDGFIISLYIDGALTDTLSFYGSIEPSIDYHLKIGRIADDGAASGRYWNGLIDEVRVWHRALSQSEISANMNNHIDPASVNDLVGYWRFNDGSGTSVVDRGIGNNTGIVNNATWDTDVPFTNGIIRPTISQSGGNLVSNSLYGNQWNLNGVPISGETGITITPSSNGTYSLTVNYGFGCIATSEPFYVVTAGIIIKAGNQQITFSLVNRVLSFTDFPEGFSNGVLELIDVNGKVIFTNKNLNEQNNLEALPVGLYLLNIHSAKATYRTKIVLY